MGRNDALDREAVARASTYMGNVAWTTIVLGLLLGGAYIVAVALAVTGTLPLWIAVPVVAAITYLSYTVLHESVHGSITGNEQSLRWLNKALGYMAAWITMIPFTAHRYEHVAHHRYANDGARDPDYHVGSMCDSPLAPIRAALQAWFSQFSYYRRHRWDAAPGRERLQLGLEVAVAMVPRLAILATGYWIEGLALFLVAWLIGAIVLLYLFAYVVHRPHEQVGRYLDTSTILPPESPVFGRALNWLWMFQNYHSIHHLFPRVPFYQYPALYTAIEEVMRAKRAPIYSISGQGLEEVPPKPAT